MSLAQRNCEVNIEFEKFERPTPRFRVKRVAVSKTMSKKKTVKQSCQVCYLHQNLQASSAREQSILPSYPPHMIFMLILPMLIGLLQVDYQNKEVSPFDTHPTNMWIFFGAACIYGVGLASNKEESHQANSSDFSSHVILSAGALASVSLASVFLPHLLRCLSLVLWTLLPVMLARHLIKHTYEWLKHVTMKTISQACDRFNILCGLFTMNSQSLPM